MFWTDYCVMSQESHMKTLITWVRITCWKWRCCHSPYFCCFFALRFHSHSLIFCDRFIHKASRTRLAVKVHGTYRTRVGKLQLMGQIMPSLFLKNKDYWNTTILFIYCQWLFLHCNSIVEYLYQKQSGLQSQTYVPPEHLQKKMH